MRFVNRQKELERLDHLMTLPEASLAVVWGRRRVGKTRLLVEWANQYSGVYFTADESTSTVQRKYFSIALEQALPGFSSVDYPDWTSLFKRLAQDALARGWRGPLVIDELPYLIAQASEITSILQRFLDFDAKNARLIVVLCGSSQRMMQGAILDASAPLYGRASEIIKLKPLAVKYVSEALNIKSSRAMVEFYAVWGGIPRYWELFYNNKGTFLEKIEKIVLDPIGPLNDELNHLLLEEYPSAISLRPILDAIGLGAHRLSEVAGRIGQPSTALARSIHRLMELELIEREIPFGMHEKNSKKAIYKIKDPFARFWFEVVASRRSLFAQSDPKTRRHYLKAALPHLFSLTWEELCRLAAPFILQKWKRTIFKPAGRYWEGKGPEWDIVTTSMEKDMVFIGEAKWTAKTPTASFIHNTIEELKQKGLPSIERQEDHKLIYGLFLPESPKKIILPKNVKLIDAQEVISAIQS
jgi:AAA+ ATPase superfamily predicted ATPase